jgi:hypothetical protein
VLNGLIDYRTVGGWGRSVALGARCGHRLQSVDAMLVAAETRHRSRAGVSRTARSRTRPPTTEPKRP